MINPKCVRLIPEPREGILKLNDPIDLDPRLGDLRFSEALMKLLTPETAAMGQIFVQLNKLNEKGKKSPLYSFMIEISYKSESAPLSFHTIKEVILSEAKNSGKLKMSKADVSQLEKNVLDFSVVEFKQEVAKTGLKEFARAYLTAFANKIDVYSESKSS